LPSVHPYPLYLLPHGPTSVSVVAVAALKPNETQPSWDVPICIIENYCQEDLVEILEGVDFPDKVKYVFSN